jgi:hypothetical protein
MNPRFPAAMFALLFLIISCASSRRVLNYDLNPGERFTLTVNRQQVKERTFGGNRMVDTTFIQSVDSFEVTSALQGGVEVTIEYGERSLEVSNAQSDPPDFEPLEGSRASFCLERTGEVKDFQGFYRLPMISLPGDAYDATRYQMELRTLFPHLPGAPLEPGKTWSHHQELQDASSGLPIDLVFDFEYTLEGPAADAPDLLAIDCAYTVSISGPVDAGDFFLDLNMAGEGTEKILFDPNRHMIAESSGAMWIEGKAVNEEAGFTVPLRNEYVTEIQASF